MSKMGSHRSFRHLKHKLWSKERSWVKLAIWFLTTSSQESTRIHHVQATCDIPLESSWQGLQLCFRPHCNQRSAHDVMCPKITGILAVRISRLPFGSPETKSHLDVAPLERHKIYYKGEGGGFPQVWAVVSLVNPNCPWLVLTLKVFQLCINHLVLVLCKFVWVVEACQFFLVPSRSSSMPFHPSKVLRAKERAPIPYFSDVSSLDV
jgi:hypothetical protein